MTSWAISSHPSSNKSPPSSPYHVGSFKKSVPEEKYDEKLPAGIGADSSSYPLAVDGDFNMGDMSGGNYILNNHTFFQYYCGSNNSFVSGRYGFKNIRNISQCEDSSTLKNDYDDCWKGWWWCE